MDKQTQEILDPVRKESTESPNPMLLEFTNYSRKDLLRDIGGHLSLRELDQFIFGGLCRSL